MRCLRNSDALGILTNGKLLRKENVSVRNWKWREVNNSVELSPCEAQLPKIFAIFDRSRRFITAFTTASQWSLS
jgi:hypothetical protein